jgi:hypothetical protein
MNNTQLYLSIGIPTFTVILAWLSNRAELNRNIDRVDRSLDALRSEMSSMRGEIVAMRNDHHKDNLALMGYMVPLHERMAKLESRS